MALQNIGAGNKDDAFYRYKMPRMITKIEGRGNGIKTNVVNMVDIAKALGRPASYTTKYFGCELGAQSKFDEKTGTSHVNGAHDTSKLAALLENFIKKFVQCYGCGNPETEILITKSQMISLKCAACGFISEVDMRDKLTTFIIKNPPESKKGSKDKKAMRRAEKERLKEGEAADEELKKLNQADEHEATPAGAEDSDDDVEWQTDTSAVAAQQTIQQQLNAVTANMVMLSADEDKKPKLVKPKVNGESNRVKPESEQFVDSIKEFVKKGSPASQLKPFLESLTGPRQEIVDVLFEALFEGVGKGFSKEAVKKKKYIAAVVEEEGSQPLLLHAIETFCGKASPEAAKEVALVLKALYDDDVLEEEFIVEWYEKGLSGGNKSSLIWKNVKPFVEWLQSAESESDEE
ncbi:eukaryotic translation initiation factor 5 [Phtheirospermum japonicum]|uniref:Eukaryotic translation initiation factor 5 n=1 Tax=Phtheirospermum japonicum TaxID=374723 RepID=A0A830BUH8_9LAMI|nr:eukaryotic translation initiation factor 5 [Phtheirospermum japonicum]